MSCPAKEKSLNLPGEKGGREPETRISVLQKRPKIVLSMRVRIGRRT